MERWDLPIVLGLAVMLFSLGALWLLQGGAERLRRMRAAAELLNRHSRGAAAGAELQDVLDSGHGWLDRLLQRAGRSLADAGRDDRPSEERMLLDRAGYRGAAPLAAFRVLRLALPLLGLAALLAAAGTQLPARALGLGGFVIFALGYLAPKYVLRALANARQRRAEEELPLLIELLRMLLGVGLSLEQSLLVITEKHAAGLATLSGELAEAMGQIGRGRSRADALHRSAEQLGIPAYADLVAVIVQADRYGGSLQEPLQQFARQLVERRRFAVQERIGKVSAKMSAVMVLFLLPALMLITAGPGFIAIIRALSRFAR